VISAIFFSSLRLLVLAVIAQDLVTGTKAGLDGVFILILLLLV